MEAHKILHEQKSNKLRHLKAEKYKTLYGHAYVYRP